VSPASGSLTVAVSGLPSGVPASVTITGTNFSANAYASSTFTNVAAGSYTISAQDVTSGSITYTPSPRTQTIVVATAGTKAVIVYGAPAPSTTVPTVSVSGSPGTISNGQGVTITWSSTAASSCSGSWITGGLEVNGSRLVAPTITTTYSVTCSGAGGTATGGFTVTVSSSGADRFTWPTDPTSSASGFYGTCGDWPGVPGACYWLTAGGWRDVQPFQLNYFAGYGYHLGADWNYGSGSADANLPVFAAADGVVSSVQANVAGWGNIIFVKHATSFGDYTSMYAHVNWLTSGPPVSGATVSRGQQIALIGNGNGLYPYHLHFEVRSGTSTTAGSGYTSSRIATGPQGQTDPNAFVIDHR